ARLRIDHRGYLPHLAREDRVAADRSHFGAGSGAKLVEVALGKLRAKLHLATLGDTEQRARARADDLAGLDAARQHQPSGGRADVEPAVARLGLGELGLGDADARAGGVASRGLAIDIGLGDEAAADQALRAFELVLRELRV